MTATCLPNELTRQFYHDGYLKVADLLGADALRRISDAVTRLMDKYPNGFAHTEGFGAKTMLPREAYPTPKDRAPTVIYHNAGFLEPDLLLPLANNTIYDTIAAVVGDDFYLSNVWVQVVPPGTGRMGYHKDEHGSVSITIPLSTIGWNSGSTCLVPNTHINTPPPNFCMADIMAQHPNEHQLSGEAGDVIFFTPETWHGRAQNDTDAPTCRLFFNFYSRSSRDATRWSNAIDPERVTEVARLFPAERRHMFRLGAIKPGTRTRSAFESWVKKDGSSSADTSMAGLVREYFYWRYAVSQPLPADIRGTVPPSFRTSIVDCGQFSTVGYLRHVHWVRTAKNAARELIDAVQARMRPSATPQAKPAPAPARPGLQIPSDVDEFYQDRQDRV
jgi:hypothetical protein